MSTQRYTLEFKEEAVRHVVERGYLVPEVAGGLGVSAHSLYKWVKAVMPTKDEKQSAELIEAKGEILRLRAQMRRLEEERDLLRKAATYFSRPAPRRFFAPARDAPPGCRANRPRNGMRERESGRSTRNGCARTRSARRTNGHGHSNLWPTTVHPWVLASNRY